MTATKPNVALDFTTHDGLHGGLCGTNWFRRVVGDQTGGPLGKPGFECGTDDDDDGDEED